MKADAFIAAIAPAAVASMAATQVPASFTIAQAALESAWGEHAPGNNLFGIKADSSWHGAVTSQRTHEDIAGRYVAIVAQFRAYPDWRGCMDDHGAFLRANHRYAAAFACLTGETFARAVAAAGYATDPQYADKLTGVIRAHSLARFDTGATA